MELHNLSPYIRFASTLKYSLAVGTVNRMYSLEKTYRAYDARLLYCLSGSGEIIVEQKHYSLQKGTLIIWKSGLTYQYIHTRQKDMVCARANFDFTYEHAFTHALPVPPDNAATFNEEAMIDRSAFLDVLYVSDALTLEKNILEILHIFESTEKYKDIECSSLMKLVITRAIALSEKEAIGEKTAASRLVEKVCNYMDEHACELDSAKQVGSIFSYHPNYLNRIILKERGKTLHDYLIHAKIQKSMKLLTSTDLPIFKIAEQCGFYDSSHFAKHFQAVTGYLPSEYRCL